MLLPKAPVSLILPMIFWLGGLVAGYFFNLPPLYLIVIISALITVLILFRYNLKILLFVVFLAGIFRYDLAEYKPANHISKIFNRHHNFKARISGEIERVISKGEKQSRYQVELDSLAGEEVAGKIYLLAETGLKAGSNITAEAELERIEGARNPGQSDPRFALEIKNIYGYGKIKSELGSGMEVKQNIRQKVSEFIDIRLDKRLGNDSPKALAITTGRTDGIGWEYKSDIRRAGLSHLFAVSGLHVGLIALIFYNLLMIIFPRKQTRIVLILLLIGYGFLCNWTASVTRAVIMLVIYSICQLKERPVNLNQILLLSLLIITLVSPLQIFSAGLQLSFAATAVLINLSPYLEKLLFRRKTEFLRVIRKRFCQSLLLTSAVVLFIAPISLANFGEFSANGLISVIPASLIFGLLLPLAVILILLPWGWQPFAWSFRFFVRLFDRWTELTASLPFYFDNVTFYYWQALLVYMLLLISLYSYRRFMRILAILMLIMIPLVFLISGIRFDERENLRITCFDCGQGDMSYLELPCGENILIDTGPERPGYGTVERSLLPWLDNRGVNEISYLIVTHAHDDHYGGLKKVLRALKVKTLVMTPGLLNELPDNELVNAVYTEESEFLIIQDTLSFQLGNTSLQFLHPTRMYSTSNLNNKSIVLRVTYGEFEGLFTGDIEKEAEDWLIENYGNQLESDFMKLPHHGSISSNTVEFINRVRPKICYIPAGKNNRFRFPHQTVIDRYKYLGDRLVNGAEEGALLMNTDGHLIEVEVMLRDSMFIVQCN